MTLLPPCRAPSVLAALAVAAVAQAPPAMEVLAGPGRPSSLLAQHLQTTPERFVVVDVGLWVDALVGDALGGTWWTLEHERARELDRVLWAVCEGLPAPRGERDVLAGIAHVARALLTNDAFRALTLPEPWRAEITAVANGRRVVRAWRGSEAAPREVDWAAALPNGGYTDARLQPLFRATVYLRRSLDALDAQQSAAWQREVDAALASPRFGEDAAASVAQTDTALRALLGTFPGPMPAVLGDLPPQRGADRAVLAAHDGPWWERLAAVHAMEPPAGDDLRTAVLRVAHTLATEQPDDAWLDAYGRARWRHKWLDLADYAYVAVREVDALGGVMGIGPDAARPRLLVEPLPRTFAALQAAFRASDPVCRAAYDSAISGDFLRELDDCRALLTHQRAGTEPPVELVDRLWQRLLHGFEHNRDDGVETRLELEGPVRRTGCHLVRIPIRWNGEDATAVAFHWCVEHRGADGTWQRARRALPPR